MSHELIWLRNKTRDVLPHAIWLISITLVYWAVFYIPLPPQFKRQGIFLVDEYILLLLVALIFLTYRQNGWGVRYIRLGLVLIVFTLPLLRLWDTAESTWNIVLGLLPWADATEYYFDASRLLEGGLFSAFSGRRPLYAGLLTVLLKLSNQNLQIVLIVFTVINAIVVFLFMEEIHNEFGLVSAIIALYLSQLFYRPFAGTTLTEQFGFPIGLLAVVVLIRAVKSTKLWLFAFGMALLTYALLIRAGTFFVLPILILFAVGRFAENHKQYIKIFLIMVAAIAVPVLTNVWLGRVVAAPQAVEFANFADTLYGQARGGVRWTQAVIDHPELASMTEPDRSQLLYRLAYEEIRNHPLGLLKGAIKAWVDFILPGSLSAFGFLTFGNKSIDFILQVSVVLIFFSGLWLFWKHRERPVSKLMLVFWAGIFLSIPFLPPVDAGVRPYTATIALLFLPVCFVFSPAVFNRLEIFHHENRAIPIGISYNAAFGLIFISLLGAPLLQTIVKPTHVQPAACESNLIPINFQLTHGSYIILSSEESGQETRVPVVQLRDVHESFDDFPYGDFAGIMRKLKQPALIAVAADIPTGRGIWIVAPAELKAYEGQTISACAELVFSTYPVMFVRTFEKP